MYGNYRIGRYPIMIIGFAVTFVVLLSLFKTLTYGPTYFYQRPVIVDERPITVINPALGSGQPVIVTRP